MEQVVAVHRTPGPTGTDQAKETEGSHVGKLVKQFQGDAPSVKPRKQSVSPEGTPLAKRRSVKQTPADPKIKPKLLPKPKDLPPPARNKNQSTPFSGPHTSTKPLQQNHNVVFQTTTPPPITGSYTLTSVSLGQDSKAPGKSAYAQVRKQPKQDEKALISAQIKAQIKLRPPIRNWPVAATPGDKDQKVKSSDSESVKPVPRPRSNSASTTTSPLYSTPSSRPAPVSEPPNYATPPAPVLPTRYLNQGQEIGERIQPTTLSRYQGKETDSEPLYASLYDTLDHGNGKKMSENPLYQAVVVPPPLPPMPEQLLSKRPQTYHRAGNKLETLLSNELKVLTAEVQSKVNTRALKKSQRKAEKALAQLENMREELDGLRNQLKAVTSDTGKAELKNCGSRSRILMPVYSPQ